MIAGEVSGLDFVASAMGSPPLNPGDVDCLCFGISNLLCVSYDTEVSRWTRRHSIFRIANLAGGLKCMAIMQMPRMRHQM